MARLVLRPDLDRVVAELVKPQVDRVARQLGDEVARKVPAAKVWISMQDPRVRCSHEDADGQTIPSNIPYQLQKMRYVRGMGGPAHGWVEAPGWDLAKFPRDPSLPIEQRINCRCKTRSVPGVTARAVTVSGARAEGARVSAEVRITFNRIAESEYATEGGGWARDALRVVRTRYVIR